MGGGERRVGWLEEDGVVRGGWAARVGREGERCVGVEEGGVVRGGWGGERRVGWWEEGGGERRVSGERRVGGDGERRVSVRDQG